MIKNIKVYKPSMLYCQKVIPLAFDESMSYYECICNIGNKINKDIIPKVNESNELVEKNTEVVIELNDNFIELQEYVYENIKTKLSQFENDTGFITKDVDDLTYYTKSSDLSSVATSGDYDDLTNKPTIPDVSNFITKDVDDLTYYTKSSDLSSVATSGDYDDLLNKPTIPDVSNFITKDVDDLTYYTPTTNLTTLLNGKENVIEYGSNTNGNYIKFDNGEMICYQSQDLGRLDYSTAFGTIFWTNQVHSWVYPVAFKTGTTPIVIPSVYTQSIGNANLQTVPTETTATCFIYCFTSNTARTTVLQWVAIGKWK